ncbi:MAG: hypothetical protein CMA71_03800 [Euryarchaeota archaeon]|jgi:hypothetical protein|nr:hypothetical protein [Euryarchaeota archaeon]DAC43531.1 MAG TPA: hypothetical protein D7H72_03270 [Candidatus Poseidoniales archaeon]|tara:strand:+ start:918 stop:1856 length:939 start_codon:yes stop_codon:yes gene_type:complete
MEAQRRVRQTAIRMLAQEYSDASLTEMGVGEYDPSFVITKLGARVNRVLVAGVIDRMERRDGDSGPSYSGHIRDPTGNHVFNIAPFQDEMHAEAEELLARFESGDRFLMALAGKSRWFETEDGGVFTSLRVEQIAIIDKERYSRWLVEAAEATLRRIKAYDDSSGVEVNSDSLEEAGVPSDLLNGMAQARSHYPEFDSENYRVGVLQALSIASGRSSMAEVATDNTPSEDETPEARENPTAQPPIEPTGDISSTIINAIKSADRGEGAEYDSIILSCIQSGFSREVAEDALEGMRDVDGTIIEPRFGFFQVL